MAGSDATTTDRALRWVGDLGHPFYSDERNRYVWYEASAIAFQMVFLGSYVMGGVLLWVGGAEAMPWVMLMIAPAVITSVFFLGYLQRRSAEYWPTLKDLKRRRGQFQLLVGVFLMSGLARAAIDGLPSDSEGLSGDGGGFSGGFLRGIRDAGVVGLVVGALAGLGVVVWKSRQQQAAEEFDEL